MEDYYSSLGKVSASALYISIIDRLCTGICSRAGGLL